MFLATAALALTLAAPLHQPGLALKPCTVQGLAARCGTLLVPENRARPAGRTIGLNVVVIPSRRKPARPDAFTYLAGGPGDAATQMALTALTLWSGVNETRDILLADQRGTGQSNPLHCPRPEGPVTTPTQIRSFVRWCLREAPGDMRQ